jgi:hypothetical protein
MLPSLVSTVGLISFSVNVGFRLHVQAIVTHTLSFLVEVGYEITAVQRSVFFHIVVRLA